jgi:Bacteriophage KPP10, Structural protein ORF10
MGVKTYDPKLVVITFGGVPLSGYADGTFVVVEREADMFTKVTGADGQTSRAKSQNRSGSVTVTLQQTSPSNDALNVFANADELSNQGVKPLTVKDLSGRSESFSANAWIRKKPNQEYAKEITNREWVIDCADMKADVKGTPDAVAA